jgi:hypothetical protein
MVAHGVLPIGDRLKSKEILEKIFNNNFNNQDILVSVMRLLKKTAQKIPQPQSSEH